MKCPRCGLVHPSSETVCRRCQIDLRTGEAASRAKASPPPVSASAFAKVRGLTRKREAAPASEQPSPGSLLEKAAARDRAQKKEHDEQAPKRGVAAVFSSAGKKSGSGISRAFGRKPAVKSISCVQCSSPMEVRRTAPFSKKGPAILLVMGAGLIIAGFFFHLLIITGGLAVIAGLLYFRVGRTYWQCGVCGFIIPRAM